MSSPDRTERRVGRSFIGLLIALMAVSLAYYLSTEGFSYNTLYIIIGGSLILTLLALHLRGQRWIRQIALVITVFMIAGYLPEPFASQDFSMTVYLPAVFALIISNAYWVLGSGAATYSLILLRGGPDSIYREPIGLIISILIVGGMALARQLTDAARARVEVQARLLEEERRLLEQRVAERTSALAAANDELREAGKHRDLFLAGVSHELRTPLNIILGNVELLSEGIYGPLGPRQQRALATVDESGQHLLRLINDLLDMARLQAGGFSIDRTPIAVSELCVQCARLMRTDIERKQLQFALELDPDAPLIDGDLQRVRQILLNLLSNAVKFTPTGGQIALRTRASEGGMVELAVSDSGIGIPAEQLGRLFKPFSQVDQRLSREYGGTGLGLALVAQLAALHGGSVGVTSKPGEGSSFWVRLPARPGGAAPAAL